MSPALPSLRSLFCGLQVFLFDQGPPTSCTPLYFITCSFPCQGNGTLPSPGPLNRTTPVFASQRSAPMARHCGSLYLALLYGTSFPQRSFHQASFGSSFVRWPSFLAAIERFTNQFSTPFRRLTFRGIINCRWGTSLLPYLAGRTRCFCLWKN